MVFDQLLLLCASMPQGAHPFWKLWFICCLVLACHSPQGHFRSKVLMFELCGGKPENLSMKGTATAKRSYPCTDSRSATVWRVWLLTRNAKAPSKTTCRAVRKAESVGPRYDVTSIFRTPSPQCRHCLQDCNMSAPSPLPLFYLATLQYSYHQCPFLHSSPLPLSPASARGCTLATAL